MASPPLPWLKPAVLVGGLAPLALLALQGVQGTLGPNVIEAVLNQTGLMALIFLVGSLACTPLKVLFGWTWPIRVRRTVGLLAFFYATLHVGVYAGLDQAFDWRAIAADVSKRPFIFVGFAAFTLLIPLAATSTNAAVRRMGYVKWSRVHTLVYPAALLAVIHFVWRVKKDVREPMTYGLILAGLLLVRGVTALRRRNEAVRRALS